MNSINNNILLLPLTPTSELIKKRLQDEIYMIENRYVINYTSENIKELATLINNLLSLINENNNQIYSYTKYKIKKHQSKIIRELIISNREHLLKITSIIGMLEYPSKSKNIEKNGFIITFSLVIKFSYIMLLLMVILLILYIKK